MYNKKQNNLEFTGLAVYKRPDEDTEHLIKRFKKMVQKDGVLQEYRDRQYFVSKSVKRKKEEKECARKIYLKNNKYKKEY